MFGKQRLTPLRLRKQTLLLKSDLHRLTLQMECQRLHQATRWMGEAGQMWHRWRPWALVVAPVAGLLFARGLRRPTRLLGSVIRIAGMILPLAQAWRTLTSSSSRS